MHVLVMSSRPQDSRRAAVTAFVAPIGTPVFLRPGDQLPAGDALIVDGPLDLAGDDVARLRERVARGLALLVLGAPAPGSGWDELTGAIAADTPPAGEYFGKVAGDAALAARVPREFAVVDDLQLLEAPASASLVDVSVRFADAPAVVTTSVGRGRITVSGVGNRDGALASPALSTLLRRCLQPTRAQPSAIGMGIVGYGPFGGMGYYHGLAAASTDGLELVAVSDSSDERRKAAETDFTGVRAYASVDELCADADVDVVVVATPPAFHATLALQLLRAGKHVACEKPLCLTVSEADELIVTARGNDVALTVNQNRRWDPDFVAIRRAVDAGLLGELFNVETFVGGFDHPCRAWHSEVSMSGGAVYDWGSHHVDWILQLMGDAPATVVTHGHKRVWHDVSNLDQLRLRLVWDDGREAEFLQSDVAAVRRPKFYLQGSAGTLVGHYRPVTFERLEAGRGYVADTAHHAEAPAELTLARYESGYGITETRLPPAPEQRFAFHRNLADHLLLGEPLAVTPESVRRVIAVLEASQRSSDEGGTLQHL